MEKLQEKVNKIFRKLGGEKVITREQFVESCLNVSLKNASYEKACSTNIPGCSEAFL